MESDFDEKDLYMGLAAFHWSRISIKDSRVDQAFYQNIIEQTGGKALELGCGAGRLLLAYLEMGLDVEGVDISPDQLSTCRRDGEAAGLFPVLYEQKMQELNLPHCYNTIYIPCGGFECMMGRRVALEALKRVYAHLNPKGVLALNIGRGHANYYLDPAEHKVKSPPEWEPRADHQLENGRRLIVYNRKIYEDLLNQYVKRERKYELYEGDKLIKEEIHIGQTHWYHRNEILWMLELAGFSDISVRGGFTDEELNQDHTAQMVFIATK